MHEIYFVVPHRFLQHATTTYTYSEVKYFISSWVFQMVQLYSM